MPSCALPKIKNLPEKRLLQSKGFYPDNLYKVISDFQLKNQFKKDHHDVLDANSDATITSLNDFYGKSYAIPDSETFKISASLSLERLNNLSNHSRKKCFTISQTDRDPFPRLSSQTVRCKTCCESIQPAGLESSSPSSVGIIPNYTNGDKVTINQPTDVKFIRKSYTVSHFDDTYSSNELKRNKVSPPLKAGAPDSLKIAERWKL